jgi:hypothetical protein
MNGKQTTIAQDLEHLFKKTVEANQQFISAGAKFVKDLGASNVKGEDLVSGQQELLSDVFNQFVKLNIQHASNLVDLGIALSQKMGRQFDPVSPEPATPAEPAKPAFVLTASGTPGTRLSTQFLLDSNKKEAITCRFAPTAYGNQETGETRTFETIFTPSSFELLPGGEAQKVTIDIVLPGDVAPAIYGCNVEVEGYENTFFSLYVKVLPAGDPSTKIPA